MLSRRRFAMGVASALAGVAVSPGALATANMLLQPGGGSVGRQASGFSRARFAQLLGSRFALGNGAGELRLTLLEMHDGPRAAGLDQFTLLFRAAGDARLPSGLFAVLPETAAPELAGQLVYLEAVPRDRTGAYYAAAFGLSSGT